MIGKPLMVDQNTEERNGLKFARLLVEVELGDQLPDEVQFKNKKGRSWCKLYNMTGNHYCATFVRGMAMKRMNAQLRKKFPNQLMLQV